MDATASTPEHPDRGKYKLIKKRAGTSTTLAEKTGTFEAGQEYTIKVEVVDNSIKVFVDTTLIFDVTDSSVPISSGKIGLYAWYFDACFDDVLVVPSTPPVTTTTSAPVTTTTIAVSTTTTELVSTTTTTMGPHSEAGTVESSYCVECHTEFSSDPHANHNGMYCAYCHKDSSEFLLVYADACASCHPTDNKGSCNLITLHDPLTNCLECHTECDDGTTTTSTGGETTITTTQPESNHALSGKVDNTFCEICHGDTHEIISDNSTTPPTTHYSIGCTNCHPTAFGGRNVTADKCSGCHPTDNTGVCNLINVPMEDDEGNRTDCLTCHAECDNGTTTTSTDNLHNSSEGLVEDSFCGTCHMPEHTSSNNLLHANHTGGNASCDDCHQDGFGPPVYATTCAICHPTSDPLTCNLISLPAMNAGLGADCLVCHTECQTETTTSSIDDNETTTTTSTGVSTSTSSVPGHTATGAFDSTTCEICHPVQFGSAADNETHVIHSISFSSDNCSICHNDGIGQTGNVGASSCYACHPQDDTGRCNLINISDHNTGEETDCSKCHTDCSGDRHIDNCLSCHTIRKAGDPLYIYDSLHLLHQGEDNCTIGCYDCSACHEGEPATGNVDIKSCVTAECHNTLMDPCDLQKLPIHIENNTDCFNCHITCGITDTTSTTSTPPENHSEVCSKCHLIAGYHPEKENGEPDPWHEFHCEYCHANSQGDGPVDVARCLECHPVDVDDAQTCDLIISSPNHNRCNTCLSCHYECDTTSKCNTSSSSSSSSSSSGGTDPQCTDNANCNDGLFCNGEETCVDGICVPGRKPCSKDETCSEGNDTCEDSGTPPLPECETDSDCTDGLFCNGEETCINNRCVDGTAPCSDSQRCMETLEQCQEVVIISAKNLNSTILRPLVFTKACRPLILRYRGDTNFRNSQTTVILSGPNENSEGVEFNSNKNFIKTGGNLIIPLSISKNATEGLWSITLETVSDNNLVVEIIEAEFQVKGRLQGW